MKTSWCLMNKVTVDLIEHVMLDDLITSDVFTSFRGITFAYLEK